MENEKRLIEVMAELLAEVHEMRIEIKGMREDFNTRIGHLENEQAKINLSIKRLEREQAKTNIAIGELRLSVMKLADFGDRIQRLEKEVYK